MLVPESSEHETILIKYKRKIGDLLKMGVLDKFLSIMKLDDGDDEYDDDEFFDDDEYDDDYDNDEGGGKTKIIIIAVVIAAAVAAAGIFMYNKITKDSKRYYD